MELALIFWGSFLLGISGAVMPGPVLTATIGEATRHGARAGPLIVLGHGVVEVTLLAGLFLGLEAWLTRDPVLGWLGLVGGAVLIWMGIAMVRTARTTAEAELAGEQLAGGRAGLRGPVLAGVGTTLSNPYWYGWWATVGISFAAQSLTHGLAGLASFFAGHIGADFAWYGAVAAGVASGRRLLSPRRYQAVIVACGLVLVAIGLLFIGLGWPRLHG